MDMIKKIALTASTMLFVLAQAFSFYVIFTSRQEKIDLLKEKEIRIFENMSQARIASMISYMEAAQK